MKNNFFCIIAVIGICLCSTNCNTNRNDKDLIRSFIEDLSSTTSNNSELRTIYIDYFQNGIKDEKMIQIRLEQLKSLGNRLGDGSKTEIFKYNEAQNMTGFYKILDKDYDNIYFIKFMENNGLVPVKLNSEGNKIVSVSTMDKGRIQVFF